MATTTIDLIAVYKDEKDARQAVRRATGAGAVASDVRINDPRDQVDSLRAEMREELEHAVIAPTAGVALTKEMSKGLAVTVPLAALSGAVLMLPFTLVMIDGWEWWERALLMLAIGAAAGGTIGTIVGAAMSARGPDDPSAAQRGVTVRVKAVGVDRPEIARALVEEHPIRLDAVDADGTVRETIVTEEEFDPDGIIERLQHQFTQPTGGEWHTTVRDVDELRAAEERDERSGARSERTEERAP